MDKLTKKQRSYNMSRIKSKNTKPEIALFRKLKTTGYKFRRHSNLSGKPDALLINQNIAIFVDGEFWHGKNFSDWKNKLNSFWYKKISDNIKRDRKNNRLLRKQGWKVVHLWGKQILKYPDKILLRIHKIAEKADLK